MNRRSFFSIAAGAAALATAMRVQPAQAVPAPVVEYDLGGPHAWGLDRMGPATTGYMNDPGHSHPISLSTAEMPSHSHSISWMHEGHMHHALAFPVLR